MRLRPAALPRPGDGRRPAGPRDLRLAPTGSPADYDYATTVFDGADDGPVPRLFVAATRHTYVLPGVTPDTVIGLAVDPATLASFGAPPLLDVHAAVNLVIGAPLFAPAL